MEELYFNSKTGYMSKKNFIKAAKLLKISSKDASDFYEKQAVNQIYKKQDQKRHFTPIESPRAQPGTLQIDLMIMTKFPKNQNKGNNYMLNILDVYSRYVKSYPLKTKSDKEVYPHIKEYIKEFKKLYPNNKISVTLDKGSEFMGQVKKYFNDNKIDIYIATPNENTKMRNMLVERYHRTFWEKLRKILTHEESLKWLDYYQDITDNYNNAIHSKTKMTPKSLFIDKEIRTIDSQVNTNILNDKLSVNDTVRFLKNKKLFTKKSFEPNWSIKTYIIHKIEGKRYYLKYDNGREKPGSYLIRELQKVESNDDKTKYHQQIKEHKKLSKNIRKMGKDKLHKVNDIGEYEVKDRIKPKELKRIIRTPKRYKK